METSDDVFWAPVAHRIRKQLNPPAEKQSSSYNFLYVFLPPVCGVFQQAIIIIEHNPNIRALIVISLMKHNAWARHVLLMGLCHDMSNELIISSKLV